MNLLTLPAYRLAEMIRQHQLTSRDLVEMALNKIQVENPTLNAVVHLRAAALKEADQLKDHGQPFLGVPLLLKGLGQRMRGEPDTNGSRLFRNQLAAETDNFVKALQNAGFIIIGQTNFPEFGYKNITDAKLFGPALNPWNPQFTPAAHQVVPARPWQLAGYQSLRAMMAAARSEFRPAGVASLA